jgi:hypothetical protein
MTQEEREAVEWLDKWARPVSDPGGKHARTLKAMLSRPALPDVNDHAAIDELKARLDADGWAISRAAVVKMLAFLREPKPRTKETTVWRVEFAVKGTGRWFAGTSTYDTENEARHAARAKEILRDMACVRVTGPHRQSIPDEGATP